MTTPTTDQLKKYAMSAARGGKYNSNLSYTEVVKTLARRLKANPKKIRRQARTQFWQ
jgi:hypothetical protein